MKLSTPARGFFLAALIGAVAMGACSLNPQPIPPGEQSGDGGNDFGGKGGTGLSDDASVADSGMVTGNPGPADAGDGGDATDAEDAGDAATDAGDE